MSHPGHPTIRQNAGEHFPRLRVVPAWNRPPDGPTKDAQMSKTEFWDRIALVNAGMLDATDGQRSVPMSHNAEPAANALWFITSKGNDIVAAVNGAPKEVRYVLADNAKGIFAELTGSLALSHDRDKLEQLWSTVADSWFDLGIDDPDVRLLSFHLTGGEVWLTPTPGIRFMFNVALAQMTGDDPDMGAHFTL
jgi:general stress protein 26